MGFELLFECCHVGLSQKHSTRSLPAAIVRIRFNVWSEETTRSRDYPEKKLNEHKEESPTLLDYGSDFPDVLVRRWMSHNPPTHENSRSQSLDRSGRVRMVKAVKRQNLSREREENTQWLIEKKPPRLRSSSASFPQSWALTGPRNATLSWVSLRWK